MNPSLGYSASVSFPCGAGFSSFAVAGSACSLGSSETSKEEMNVFFLQQVKKAAILDTSYPSKGYVKLRQRCFVFVLLFLATFFAKVALEAYFNHFGNNLLEIGSWPRFGALFLCFRRIIYLLQGIWILPTLARGCQAPAITVLLKTWALTALIERDKGCICGNQCELE